MKEFYKDFIGVYENALDEKTCLQVIKIFEESQTKVNRDSLGVRNANEDIRDQSIELCDEKLVKIIKNKLFYYTKIYRKKYRYFPDCVGIKDVKVQKTNPTEGYHVFHQEAANVFNIEEPLGWFLRKGVYTIYLNDVEEGGETEFLYQKFRLKPKRGTICIFPSEFTHTHRGNSPFSNSKYIVTGWLSACPGNEASAKQMIDTNSLINEGTKLKELTKNNYFFKDLK